MARLAEEIEPPARIFSSNWILPGPIRPPVSRSIRRLKDGTDADDFCMLGGTGLADRDSYHRENGSGVRKIAVELLPRPKSRLEYSAS